MYCEKVLALEINNTQSTVFSSSPKIIGYQNEEDKGKPPVITKVELASTGTSVVASAKYTDEDTDIMAAGQVIAGFLRQHDYVGMSDGKIYVLLSNTREEEAVIVVNSIAEKGYSCRIVEGDAI